MSKNVKNAIIKTKTISCNKQKYTYYLNCLKVFCEEYSASVTKSLVIDEQLYKLGFSNYVIYTFTLSMPEEKITEITTLINSYRNNNYDEFEYYAEFYNLLNTL